MSTGVCQISTLFDINIHLQRGEVQYKVTILRRGKESIICKTPGHRCSLSNIYLHRAAARWRHFIQPAILGNMPNIRRMVH